MTISEQVSHDIAIKVYCQARPDYHLTASPGGLVLMPGNDADPRQHWILDDAWGMHVKDEAGFPAFALINASTMQALRHGNSENEEVQMLPYDQQHVDEGFLWSFSGEVGDGFRCIRSAGNIALNMDAEHGDANIQPGIRLIMFTFNNQENQKWKIEPLICGGGYGSLLSNQLCTQVHIQPSIVRLYIQARPNFFLTIRNSEVFLAPGNLLDKHQEWIKENFWGVTIKDETGSPAFALVNVATRQALKHRNHEWDRVEASSYTEKERDDGVLWTLSGDAGQGYQCIRPASNVHLNLDAKYGDDTHGGVQNGNELILFRFNNQANQKWKILFM